MSGFFANGWIERDLVEQFAAAGTNAHRVFSSRNAWIERLGSDFLISYKDSADLAELQQDLAGWITFCEVEGQRVFGRYLAIQNSERNAPVLLSGDSSLPLETTVLENSIRYGLDFAAGYSVGLFLDQRANRVFLQAAKPARVLNTFAYTCSFSVAAASVGAKTVSIDLSAKSIGRGKANFALNELSTEGHRFLADDALEVMPRLVRKMELFNAIILDPPTFSRGAKGKKFQVEKNLGDLLHLALELSAPQAHILLSTNCTRLDREALQLLAREELKVAQRRAEYHVTDALPDFPEGEGAATLWLLLD
ncbi:MAG TPA: class I SAM-dependent methyltransferase [Chthoniobacterales bacterium]|jgi:23S rRNA (cytosine1962-C5)-methyltransferase